MEDTQVAANARSLKQEFEKYATALLDRTDLAKDAPVAQGSQALNESEQDAEADTCRNAVEVVSRNAQRGKRRALLSSLPDDFLHSGVRRQQRRIQDCRRHASQVCVPARRHRQFSHCTQLAVR